VRKGPKALDIFFGSAMDPLEQFVRLRSNAWWWNLNIFTHTLTRGVICNSSLMRLNCSHHAKSDASIDRDALGLCKT
jgi:hypothetical protein